MTTKEIIDSLPRVWKEKRGVVTPGGDPFWHCPICGKGGHLYGVESPKNYCDVCKDCGAELKYPWEVES